MSHQYSTRCPSAGSATALYLRFEWLEGHQPVTTPLVLASYGTSDDLAAAQWFWVHHLPLLLEGGMQPSLVVVQVGIYAVRP